MNEKAESRALVRRALTHRQAGTSDLAETQMRVPISAYLDEDRYQRELDAVFKNLPIAIALSLELPEPGSYVARTVLQKPLLLVRGEDGVVRAFLNVCRHRGARLCDDGHGKRDRFTCPYHAWTYDHAGALVHVYAQEKFGEFDTTVRSLTGLTCAERSGVVFVCLNPETSFDIDVWLGDMQPRLDTLQLDDWVLFEQRDLPSPGWKPTLEGYLEVYHHDIVHRTTVGQHTIGNLLVHDTFGPHQRLTFARKTLDGLGDKPEDDWQPEAYIRLVHSVFPNFSVSGIVGGHCLVSQIFPGATLDETVTRQYILCASGEQDEAWLDGAREFSQLSLEAVRDEDYAIVHTVQSGLRSGANEDFLLGRNEPAVQHYHDMVARIADATADELTEFGVHRAV